MDVTAANQSAASLYFKLGKNETFHVSSPRLCSHFIVFVIIFFASFVHLSSFTQLIDTTHTHITHALYTLMHYD